MERIHRIAFVVVLVMATLAGSVTAVKAGDLELFLFFQDSNFIPSTDLFESIPKGESKETDITINSNTPLVDTLPTLTIDFDECWHMGQSIICPPGVKPGSNSMYLDWQGWPVFPDMYGGEIAVPLSEIEPYPGSVPGVLGVPLDHALSASSQVALSQTTYSQVTFSNVLFYNTGKTQKVTISGLSFDKNALFKKYPGTNPSIWLTVSVSPTTGLTVNNPQFPYAVLTNYTPACDESFGSITPGYPTYIRARNIAFNGNLYEVDMPVVTLPDGSLGFSVLAVRQGSNCPNTGNSLSQDFVLTLSKVNVNGTDYWAQFQWTGSAFKLLNAH